jgi:uncharacterized protein (DUF1800 family)
MLEPLPNSQWNATTAAHLLNRAGFGGSPTEIENLRKMGRDGAISWLVDYDRIPDLTPAPDWAASSPDLALLSADQALKNAMDEDSKKELRKERNRIEYRQMADLRYWWIRRMALGPRPFQEKMTLFWHGHFATSFEKVRSPYFLWLQNETLRQNALGIFPELLTAVAKDPAMLVYLDGASSRREDPRAKHPAKPNENFAREVMELFTLGEGHYSEQDIQEAARAYTGWGLNRDRTGYEYHPRIHDDGVKTIFGQSGNFTGEDVLAMICGRPECAPFITEKLWRFFAQDPAPKPVVDALAEEFRANGMDVKKLMTVIFRSGEFYAPEVIRGQIKSPVQWLVASTHQLQAPLPTLPMSLVMLLQLGQELFQPPNVKGWDGGIAWITTTNLLNRYNFAAALVEGERVPLPNLRGQMKGVMNNLEADGLMQIAPASVMPLFTANDLSTPDLFLDALQARFLQGTLQPQRLEPMRDFLKTRSPLTEDDIRKSIRLLMSTPEYQLT